MFRSARRDTPRTMSEEATQKAELVRSNFAAWARGDFASGIEPLAADIQYSAAQPEGQAVASGRTETVRFMRDFLAAWDRYWIELHDLQEPAPGVFLATGTQFGRGKNSGAQTSRPTFTVIAFRGDEIARLEFFWERGAAVDALDDANVGPAE
jgi:ketosteroid isomerase-like protein